MKPKDFILYMIKNPKIHKVTVILFILYYYHYDSINRRLTNDDVTELYTKIGYDGSKTIYEVLSEVISFYHTEPVLDLDMINEQLWFWCDSKGLITEEEKNDLIALI